MTSAPTLFDMPESAFRRRSCPVCGGALSATNSPRGGLMTYAIGRQRWVKLGKTTNLAQRLRDLRRLNRPSGGVMVTLPPEMDYRHPLFLINSWLGDWEHQLHLRYAKQHAAGEWFLPNAAMWRELEP